MHQLDQILSEVAGYYPNADLALIRRAYQFAAAAHDGQTRKSGDPYVTHPLAVAQVIAELKLDVASVCAGLLHDCVEDTSETSENGVPCEVMGRAKHLWSIYQKMKRTQRPFAEIHDAIGFRVITDTQMHCYQALGVSHQTWTPIPGRFKDYIALPKPNLYQSLHTAVIGPKGERIEIQIRTGEMNLVAAHGVAAHWKYKEGQPVALEDDKKFAWLRQLMESQKELRDPTEFLESVKIDLFGDEVYVFTPQGDVKALPKGSCPIDFAYSVNSSIGDHCSGARVNGMIVPLRY